MCEVLCLSLYPQEPGSAPPRALGRCGHADMMAALCLELVLLGPGLGCPAAGPPFPPKGLGKHEHAPMMTQLPKNALRREPSMASTLPGLGPHLEPSLTRTLLRPWGVSSLLGPRCLEDGVLTASCTQAGWWTQRPQHMRAATLPGPSLELVDKRPQRMRAATLPGPSLELVDTEASARVGGHPPWPFSGAGGHRGLSACGRPPFLASLWPSRLSCATAISSVQPG